MSPGRRVGRTLNMNVQFQPVVRLWPATFLLAVGCPDQGLTTYNADPVATILSPVVGDTVTEGQLVPLRGQVSDSNHGPTDLVATWFIGEAVLCEAAPPDADGLAGCGWTADLSGAELRLEVLDVQGAAATASLQLHVNPNAQPLVDIVLPTGEETYYAGSLVELYGTATDAEDVAAALGVTWASSIEGVLAVAPTVSDDGHSRGAVTLVEGEHFITLTATDSYGRSATDTVILDVGPPKQEPSVVILAPVDGTTATENVALSFEATVSDGQDPPDALVLAWSSDRDGVFDASAADSTGRAAFSTASLSRGAHVVTLLVSDTDGNTASAAIGLDVNGVPSMPGVAVGPTPARTDDPLVASLPVPSIDPDGDPVTYTWTWLQNGVDSGLSSTESLPAIATTKGEVWTVEVTPNDGLVDGPPGSASVTIANTPPSLTTIDISPTDVMTNDVLTANAATADVDGDTVDVLYTWFVDGTEGGRAATLDGATGFDKGAEVYVAGLPTDGSDAGDELVSAPITVQNSPPAAASAMLSPPDPLEGVNDLVCLVESSDADNDTLSWSIGWTVDGVVFADATTTTQLGDTVPAELLGEGESWTCTATASDGEASGASGTASGVVGACPTALAEACPGVDCAELLSSGIGTADGRYWIAPDGGAAFEAYCDQSHDGGGWTLVAVASDDATDTWTYTARRAWDLDTTTFGSLAALEHDYKGEALARLLATDVLVVHQPSGTWAAYASVGSGVESLAAIIAAFGDEACWKQDDGFGMTAGSLVASGGLCDTDLYLNAADHDGGGGSCTCADCTDDAHGPSWNVDTGGGCPFDNPGSHASLGPSSDSTGETTAVGFGESLGLNSGAAGAAENYAWVLVR